MSEPVPWGELDRAQRKVLERLWAGGSTRGLDRVTLIGLALMGYVEDDRLTPVGEELCADALNDIVSRLRESYPDIPSTDLRRRFAQASPASEGSVSN